MTKGPIDLPSIERRALWRMPQRIAELEAERDELRTQRDALAEELAIMREHLARIRRKLGPDAPAI